MRHDAGMSFENRDVQDDEGRHGFVLGADEGDAYWWLGTLSITKLRGDRTEGGVDIVDHRVPAGYAPPLHVHRGQDEIFFVLEGQLSIRCGPDAWEAGAGSMVFLPRDVPHGFVVTGDGPARTLLINAPAGFAEVVTALGDRADELVLPGPDVAMPQPERVAEVTEAHGIHGASS